MSQISKRLAGLSLGLVMASGAIAQSGLRGTYQSAAPQGGTLTIDEFDRVQTNLQVRLGQTAFTAGLTFPQALRYNGVGILTSRGYYQFNYRTRLGLRQCTFFQDVEIYPNPGGSTLQISLIGPAHFGADVNGTCFQMGEHRHGFTFNRIGAAAMLPPPFPGPVTPEPPVYPVEPPTTLPIPPRPGGSVTLPITNPPGTPPGGAIPPGGSPPPSGPIVEPITPPNP